MKIAYLLAHPGNGGAEAYALNLAREARNAGHEVCFVLGERAGQLVDRVRTENFDLLILPMQSSFNPFAVISSVYKLRKFIHEFKPDIIHTQMLREQSLVIGAKILGAKTRLVRTFHRLDQFNWKMAPLMWLYRKYTDSFIAISEYVRDYLAENGIEKNITVVHNGVAEVVAENKKPGLGYLGRISPEKGIKAFVEANEEIFAKEPLVVGGNGPDLEALKAFVKRKNLNIQILGNIEEKDDFFGLFSVLVLPSSTEALPLVVLEAFSAGTPVVAFDLPSLKGLITDKNGALVGPGDYKALAKKAIEIMKSKDYENYAANARRDFEQNYTVEKMWSATELVYQNLCRES